MGLQQQLRGCDASLPLRARGGKPLGLRAASQPIHLPPPHVRHRMRRNMPTASVDGLVVIGESKAWSKVHTVCLSFDTVSVQYGKYLLPARCYTDV